jgi:hypothetical protein
VVRFAVALCLTASLSLAFEAASILGAKLGAVGGGAYPCVVRGAVTARLSPEDYYIQDQTSGIRIHSQAYQLHDGDRLEVRGWTYLGDSGEFRMRAGSVWYLGHGPPAPPRLSALPDVYSGSYQGQLVVVRGAVLNVDFGELFDTISIRHDRASIRVFYPASHGGHSVFERIYPGMQVAVTGVSVPQTADPEFDGYQVRLRGPADLAIRPALVGEQPSRRKRAGGMAAALFAGAATWIWTSRPRRTARASQVQ